MANIKSAKKRVLTSRTRAARNKSDKTAMKTSMKKVLAAVESGDKAAATAALSAATKALDQAAARNLVHPNKAAHKVSQLSKAVNKMA